MSQNARRVYSGTDQTVSKRWNSFESAMDKLLASTSCFGRMDMPAIDMRRIYSPEALLGKKSKNGRYCPGGEADLPSRWSFLDGKAGSFERILKNTKLNQNI